MIRRPKDMGASNWKRGPVPGEGMTVINAFVRKKIEANHLRVRGDGHPKSKAVITPKGRFGSAALAADAYDIGRRTACYRAKYQMQGWRYETEALRMVEPTLPFKA